MQVDNQINDVNFHLIWNWERSQVDKSKLLDKIKTYAEVAELADALRSGRSEPWAHEGSTPSFGTTPPHLCRGVFVYFHLLPLNWYNICNQPNTDLRLLEAMKKILTDKRVIVAALAIILVMLLVDFNQRMVLLSKLRGQEKVLNEKYAQLESTLTALETELAYAQSDQSVEKWAREEAGMIQEGDIPIVLLPPTTQVRTPPPPEPEIEDEVQPWEIWQELFFGQ